MVMGGKRWLWITAYYILAMILIITFLEFKALDKKIDKAIEQQQKINQKMYDISEYHSKTIKYLQTDTQILMNIVINGDYCMEDQDAKR